MACILGESCILVVILSAVRVRPHGLGSLTPAEMCVLVRGITRCRLPVLQPVKGPLTSTRAQIVCAACKQETGMRCGNVTRSYVIKTKEVTVRRHLPADGVTRRD
jgi:hypothetical protein